MFVEVKKQHNIIVYATKHWSKELSKSLWCATKMNKKQETLISQSGLSFHLLDSQCTNGFSLTLTKNGIKHDVIGIA